MATQTKMDLTAAKTFIIKHKQEGLTNKEIAKRLKAQGYVSDRTGKPIDEFGVGYHIRNEAPKVKLALAPKEAGPAHPVNGHAKLPQEQRKGNGSRDSLIRLALEVLQSTDLDPTVAKEVAAKILNS